MILVLLVFSCTDNYGHMFPADPELQRKDSITLALNNEINPDSIKSTVSGMQGMITRFALADNHREVAVKIMKHFNNLGYSDVHLDSFYISLYPDSIIIVGAHYDDILISGDPLQYAPGANDNASGVASVIEIAWVMKLKNHSPACSIEFVAFGAEELGLLGSADMASRYSQGVRAVKMMINFDMVAYEPDPNEGSWSVNIINYPDSRELLSVATSLCARYGGIKCYNDNKNAGSSDSYSFAKSNIKALYFASKNPDSNYHTYNDISSSCNFIYCSEIVKTGCALIVYSE
jgi:hypothetical protein